MSSSLKFKSIFGGLILGGGLVTLGLISRNFAEQNFACNAASDFGEKTPLSCPFYQLAFETRTWAEVLGWIFVAANGLLLLFYLHEKSLEPTTKISRPNEKAVSQSNETESKKKLSAESPSDQTPTPKTVSASTSRRNLKYLIALAVVVAAIPIVILISSHSSNGALNSSLTTDGSTNTYSNAQNQSSSSSNTDESPQLEAESLSSLLQSATPDRSELQNAIDEIQGSVNSHAGCTSNVANAVSAIQQVTSDRQNLLQQLGSTSLTELPNGQALANDLDNSWTISEQIDQDFSQWATTQQENNCQVSDSNIPSYQATNNLDSQSTAMKTTFVNLWNPIAQTFNQPSSWTAAEI